MIELLSYDFIQRALVVGVLIGMSCSVLGVFLILRRDAMIGHGLAHVTFGGVALGLILEVVPLLAALAVAVLAALGIMRLKQKAGVYSDTAIAIFASVGMALGVLLASMAGSLNVGLFAYLFGSILAIGPLELWTAVALSIAILMALIFFYQQLLYLTFDPESARTGGISVELLESLLAVLTAVTVVLGMKVVGILLVAALLVIPAAAALQLASSFYRTIITASLLGAGSVAAGLLAAGYFDLPAAATIVLAATLCFVIALGLRLRRNRPFLA